MKWELLLLISIAAGSVSAVLQRAVVSKKEMHPYVFAASFQICVAFFIGIYLLFAGFHIPSLKPIILNLVLMPVFYVLGNVLKFKSLKEIEVSELIVIYQISTFVTVFIAVFLMNESFVFKQYMGLILIVIAIFLVTIKNKITFKLSKKELLALMGAIASGVAFANDAYILRTFDFASYAFVAFLIPGIIVLFLARTEIKGIKKLAKKENRIGFFSSTFLYTISCLTVYAAYQVGRNVAQISSIGQISTILIVILGAIFLKETDRLPRKLLAAVLSVLGVILLK